ncbi:hypothetical protein EMIHUDRAFT_74083 [Emiliania huxleyi CCMP1516]|uniref:Surface antigen-like protein n=2 Tax=Emiliania huxleyi TaxID=2903 RepID=A0A0D3JMN4_EMIH1|nr:hypothetical protein EMIHUDRAFT_74083 [Emiliania huxleyi CCMP1516]EOD24769.1 hypothetical protein EMIHUDRAFT_74083 [Emiliania huxleyi CCMP1516]|eukprot:XP_005777198.1 hypothetical protein EMIHUDRAFT_74083 [Emiliania huxleyi CCMP1516]
MTHLPNNAFSGRTLLVSVAFPSLVSIGYRAFFGCRSLTGVTFPAGLTAIGDYTFSGCSSLTSVVLPADLTSLAVCAFDRCSSLTSVGLPPASPGLTSVGDEAFNNCSALTSVTFPAGLAFIGERAFYNCRSLTRVTLPAGLNSIGNYAFDGAFPFCPLSRVIVPTTANISSRAFSDTTTILRLLPRKMRWYAAVDLALAYKALPPRPSPLAGAGPDQARLLRPGRRSAPARPRGVRGRLWAGGILKCSARTHGRAQPFSSL